MARDMEADLRLLQRVVVSADGPELLEYLRSLSADNYRAFKADPESLNEYHKGYANGIDSLIECLERSGETLKRIEEQREAEKAAALGETTTRGSEHY